MTRKDIARVVSEKTGLSRRDSEAVVVALFAAMRESLLQGDSITVRGFGTFGLKYQRARKGRLIRTGKEIPIPPRVRVYFEPSPHLQAAVSERKDLLERFAQK
ncbi:MAG: HU family DNA-binding protein [Bacteroidia bacterium]|nr:HU family DNA-binding protein [Bacteroidia bacterium]